MPPTTTQLSSPGQAVGPLNSPAGKLGAGVPHLLLLQRILFEEKVLQSFSVPD